jgi:hypothetical protein
MDLRIEIAGDKVTCKQDGQVAMSLGLAEFLGNLNAAWDNRPAAEPIAETVRFFWQRGEAVVLVMEQKPACHTVRWLADDSQVKFGRGATYREARLAFPFVVLVLAFHGGNLTGQQQCFYRRSPLGSIDDELLLPNLLNVACAYDQTCWLCLANLSPVMAQMSWAERVRTVWSHLFQAGFNASSEHHEGNSYWQTMRSVDPRVAGVAAWEAESARNPFFPLDVGWRPSGKTVRAVMDETMSRVWPLRAPGAVADLLPFFNVPAPRKLRRGSWWK